MRSQVVILSLALLAVVQSGAAQDVEDDIALKNWPVSFDGVARTTRTPAERFRPRTASVPSVASHFISIVPCRLVDTRLPAGPYGGPSFTNDSSRDFNIPANPCNVPVASAYSLNVTATRYKGRGFITAYPAGGVRPGTSTLNFGTPPPPPDLPPSVANAAIVPADSTGTISIYAFTATDVVIDINGYFVEGVVTSITPTAPLIGGGSGSVSVAIAPNGITSAELGPESVTTGAIKPGNVTADRIGAGEVVKSINGLKDTITITGSGGATVTATGNTVTVNAPASTPSAVGSIVLGFPNDTTLIAAGYTELGASTIQAWRALSSINEPTPRDHHTAIWTGTKMIVWGGWGPLPPGTVGANPGAHNDGGIYDPATDSWTPMSTTNAPEARTEHSAVWAPERGEMIVWGGYASGTTNDAVNSGGRYTVATNTWDPTPIPTTGVAPSKRERHTAIWTGSRMVIWGGGYSVNGNPIDTVTNTGGIYDPATNTWLATNIDANTPAGREMHTAVWTGAAILIWGGWNPQTTDYNDGARFDPATNSWTALGGGAAPSARHRHTAVWTGSKMIVWGGALGYDFTGLATGGVYDPTGPSWTATPALNAPDPRLFHVGLWTGKQMLIWGGYSSGIDRNTGATYDPLANTWTGLPIAGAPIGRRDFGAVWTNSNRLVVFGGNSDTGSGYLGDGAQILTLSLYRKN